MGISTQVIMLRTGRASLSIVDSKDRYKDEQYLTRRDKINQVLQKALNRKGALSLSRKTSSKFTEECVKIFETQLQQSAEKVLKVEEDMLQATVFIGKPWIILENFIGTERMKLDHQKTILIDKITSHFDILQAEISIQEQDVLRCIMDFTKHVKRIKDNRKVANLLNYRLSILS